MATYRFTSGRMLHVEDCDHFYDDMPPREATPEELANLPVCATCAGRSGDGRSASGTSVPERFTCPSCQLSPPRSLQTSSGACRDCVDAGG